MSEFDVNQALNLSGGEESMEQEDLAILNESKENSEQDLPKVAESDSVIDKTPIDPQVKVVPEAIHQELVDKTGKKGVTSDEEDEDEEEPGLDKYLDTFMIDMTMSVVKAKKAGDLVAIVSCLRRVTQLT